MRMNPEDQIVECNEEGKTFCDLPEKTASLSDAQLEDYWMVLFNANGDPVCSCSACRIRLDRVVKRQELSFASGGTCENVIGANKPICGASIDNDTGVITLKQNSMPVTAPIIARLYSENANWTNNKGTGTYELEPLTISWTNNSCNVCYQVVVDRFMDAYFNQSGGEFSLDARVINGWNGVLNGGESKGISIPAGAGPSHDYVDLNLERVVVGPIVCPGETVTFTMQGTLAVTNPSLQPSDRVDWHYKMVMTQFPVRYQC